MAIKLDVVLAWREFTNLSVDLNRGNALPRPVSPIKFTEERQNKSLTSSRGHRLSADRSRSCTGWSGVVFSVA